MTEEELKRYIPKYGDRVVVRQFSQSQRATTSKTDMEQLTKVIKNKIYKTSDTGQEKRVTKGIGNTNAKKTERRIEIGWLNYDEGTGYKQVRKKGGGGVRHLTTRCTATVNELVCIATGLFFPDGKSSKGKLENFDFEMMDFMNRILDSDVTVQELYDSLKVKMLRIYLATKIKSDAAERVSCSSEEETADDE